MKKLTIGDIWETCRGRIYDNKKYVESLDRLLSQENVGNIHIAACGTGDVALELSDLRYIVSCSDNNRDMLDIFYNKIQKGELPEGKIKVKQTDMRELSSLYGNNVFDCVYCGGNSMPWVDSWDKREVSLKETPNSIKKALKNFYQIVKPGGILVIDLHNENETTHSQDLGQVILKDGTKEHWQWEVEHDRENKIRTWHVKRKNRRIKEYSAKCYLPTHKEFIDMVKGAGFKTVQKLEMLKGTPYTVYLARK